MFDYNSDGTIDIAELSKGLSALGAKLTVVQVAALRDAMDTDGDVSFTRNSLQLARRALSWLPLRALIFGSAGLASSIPR